MRGAMKLDTVEREHLLKKVFFSVDDETHAVTLRYRTPRFEDISERLTDLFVMVISAQNDGHQIPWPNEDIIWDVVSQTPCALLENDPLSDMLLGKVADGGLREMRVERHVKRRRNGIHLTKMHRFSEVRIEPGVAVYVAPWCCPQRVEQLPLLVQLIAMCSRAVLGPTCQQGCYVLDTSMVAKARDHLCWDVHVGRKVHPDQIVTGIGIDQHLQVIIDHVLVATKLP